MMHFLQMKYIFKNKFTYSESSCDIKWLKMVMACGCMGRIF